MTPHKDEELIGLLEEACIFTRDEDIAASPTDTLLRQAASRIKALVDAEDALHEGLRERGMRLESTAPGQDALNAISEWKAIADRLSTRVGDLEGALGEIVDAAEMVRFAHSTTPGGASHLNRIISTARSLLSDTGKVKTDV